MKGHSIYFLAFLIVHVLYSHKASAKALHNTCTTYAGKQGTCVRLHQCDSIQEHINNNPLERLSIIMNSICSVGFLSVSVCCPLQESSTTTASKNESRSNKNLPPSYYPLYPPECGYSNKPHDRVVGGTVAALGAYPWMAAVGFRFGVEDEDPVDIVSCGGALVSARHVVTAAHCMELDEVDYIVILGEKDLESTDDGADPITVLVESYVVHPDYNNVTKENDIAILRLKEDVAFTKAIHPICLPLKDEIKNRNFVGTFPFVAGWGDTSYKGPSSSKLLEVQIPVVTTTQCKNSYVNKTAVIDERVLCAGYPNGGKDACQGDSGGPLMFPQRATYYLIGVVSSGYHCATAGYPGIYTSITHFLDFIISHLK